MMLIPTSSTSWRQGFREWRAREADDAECVFVCELGAPPYPVTGPDGNELSDRWQEALLYRDWARQLFDEARPAAASA